MNQSAKLNLLRFQLSDLDESAYVAKLTKALPAGAKVTIKQRQLTVAICNTWVGTQITVQMQPTSLQSRFESAGNIELDYVLNLGVALRFKPVWEF